LGEPSAIEENTCGFCGRNGTCTIALKVATTKKLLPQSNCPLFVAFKLASASKFNTSKSWTANHCTNYPVVCPGCTQDGKEDKVYWKYNLPKHYSLHHASLSVPEDLMVCKNEKLWFMKNKT